jgi:hypothetical protein
MTESRPARPAAAIPPDRRVQRVASRRRRLGHTYVVNSATMIGPTSTFPSVNMPGRRIFGVWC